MPNLIRCCTIVQSGTDTGGTQNRLDVQFSFFSAAPFCSNRHGHRRHTEPAGCAVFYASVSEPDELVILARVEGGEAAVSEGT